jgi:hypothetical protein
VSKKYDHHWKKGYEKKGEPLGIPSAAAAFFARERALKAKKKRKKGPTFKESLAAADAARANRPQGPSPKRIAGKAIEDAQAKRANLGENLERIEEMVAPILAREGYERGQFIPGSLTTKLMLSGRGMDARLVTRLIAARGEYSRAVAHEREGRAEYARVAAQERSASPVPSNVRIVPPWSGDSQWAR